MPPHTDSKVTIEKVEARLGRKLEKPEEGAVKRWMFVPHMRYMPVPGTSRELLDVLLEIEGEE